MPQHKLIRITTVPVSLKILLRGQLRFMSENGFEVIGVSSSGKDLEAVAQRENIRTMAIEMTRMISPIRDVISVWQLYRIFKNERPVIVHSHTPKAGTVGLLAAKLAGVPIRFHTVAGLPLMEASGVKRIVLDVVEKVTYRCASKVYPNSKGLYDLIIQENYASKNKLKVIGQGSSNGIDTSFFNPIHFSASQNQTLRNSLGIQPSDFVFTFIGRLVGDKGINELVKAVKNLKFKTNNLKLVLVGRQEYELDPLLPDTLQEMEKNINIIWTGFQEDVRPFFAISNALVFPSYREGFPNVVMQAGAMGLPSIVSDINGCNEIIIDGINGLIIPPKDTEALQNAMLRFVEDSILYNKLKSTSRELITSRYEQKLFWEALLDEYNLSISQM